jgi:glycosidase
MTNVDYENLEDFRDVEVFTEYKNFMSFGATHDIAMQALRDRSRDNARSPFQWNDSKNGGFSDKTPWMNTVKNYKEINLEKQRKEDDSIFKTYQKVFKLRKELEANSGKIEFLLLEDNESFVYKNKTPKGELLVVSNFRDYPIQIHLDIDFNEYEVLISNYQDQNESELRAYESTVYLKKG